MSIFITGDTHGDITRFSTHNLRTNNIDIKRNDYIIITGDFGMIWNQDYRKKLKWWSNWLNQKGYTLLFIDGNHENFDIINSLPVTKMFGGNVHVVFDNIIHLMRGQIFTIENKKFFTFGGATSIDKMFRKEHVSWWKEEMPTIEEQMLGLFELEKQCNNVDYIITHTAPSNFIEDLLNHQVKSSNSLTNYFQIIYDTIDFKKWFCGHFHNNKIIKDNNKILHCLYEDIIKIEGDD